MKKVCSFVVAFLFFVSASPEAGFAADTGTLVQRAGEAVLTAFNEARDAAGNPGTAENSTAELKLKTSIFKHFDFAELSKRCVGQSWEKATSEQRQEFISLFQQMLAKSLLGLVRREIGNWKLAVVEQNENQGRAAVKATLTSANDSAKADFSLIFDHGAWLVHNVAVAGFSLERIYQVQFSRIAEKEGLPGLLARLRGKV